MVTFKHNGKLLKFLLLTVMVFFSTTIYAYHTPTVGEIADKLHIVGHLLTRLMWFGCFVVGGILVAMSLGMVRSHIMNPKAVPLDRVFMYFIFGAILILVPFLGRILGIATGSPMDLKLEKHKHNPFVRHEFQKQHPEPTLDPYLPEPSTDLYNHDKVNKKYDVYPGKVYPDYDEPLE